MDGRLFYVLSEQVTGIVFKDIIKQITVVRQQKGGHMRERILKPGQPAKHMRTGLIILTVLLVFLLLPVRSHAAVYKDKWVNKKDRYYYYDARGQRLKGIRKIGKHIYYLDSKGVQHTGWRKIKKKYYFFQTYNGSSGYMVVSKKVNGIKLNKDGSAKVTSSNKRKIKLMVKCQKILDSIAPPGLGKRAKLRKAFEYTKSHYAPRNVGGFSGGSGWDVRYADYMISAGSGDCYSYGAVFAYMANAVGYKNVYACSSGGHGWCRIHGKYYDPNWARVIGSDKCYAATRGESGSNGRPAWATNELYAVKIS